MYIHIVQLTLRRGRYKSKQGLPVAAYLHSSFVMGQWMGGWIGNVKMSIIFQIQHFLYCLPTIKFTLKGQVLSISINLPSILRAILSQSDPIGGQIGNFAAFDLRALLSGGWVGQMLPAQRSTSIFPGIRKHNPGNYHLHATDQC